MSAPVLQIDRIVSTDDRFGSAKQWEYQLVGSECTRPGAADDESEFFVGFTGNQQPVAILRASRCNPQLGIDSFRTVRDASAYPAGPGGLMNMIYRDWQAFFATVSPKRVAELATQAARLEHRETSVLEQLWRQAADALAAEGVGYLTVAPTAPVLEQYQSVFGEAVEQFGDILPAYDGADRIPAVIDLNLVEPRS